MFNDVGNSPEAKTFVTTAEGGKNIVIWLAASKKGHSDINVNCHLGSACKIPTINDPKEDGCGKHCGKKRNCW